MPYLFQATRGSPPILKYDYLLIREYRMLSGVKHFNNDEDLHRILKFKDVPVEHKKASFGI